MTLASTLGDDARFRAKQGILSSGDEHGSYLTDVETGAVFELNETARFIFEHASRGEPLRAIIAKLSEVHAVVPVAEIDRDVRESVDEFVARGLLEALP